MPLFLANRGNLQTKRLHRRLKHRLQTDGIYSKVRLTRASPRDPGRYRVTVETNPRVFFSDSAYPTEDARIEVGFELFTAEPDQYYWLNWVEPERNFLVGWHQDKTHPELGPVHLQLNYRDKPIVHKPAEFIDSHPLDVFSRRLAELPAVIQLVEWAGDRPIGIDY